jgi:hypothetical protein
MAAAAVEREPDILTGTSGFYLDYELPRGSEDAAERLENRHKHVEFVAVRPESGIRLVKPSKVRVQNDSLSSCRR